MLKNNFNKWLAFAISVCCLSLFFLNMSSIPVILTTIESNLNFSSNNLEWIVNSYLLSFAILILPLGKLADFIGFRSSFCLGLSLYILGSLICGVCQNPNQLILGRVIQGFSGAAMFPITSALLMSAFPKSQWGKALGFSVGIGLIFFMLGPILGGIFAERYDWRYVFLLNLPIAFLGLIMVLKYPKKREIKEQKVKKFAKKFDYLGAIFLGLSMGSINIGLMQGAKWGWGSLNTFFFFVATVLFLLLFFVSYKRNHEPIIDLSLFKQRFFMGATSCGCLGQLIGMVTVFWVLYFQQSLGFNPITAGWAILLTNFPSIFIAPLGGHLADSLGVKWPVALGFSFAIFALLWITIFSNATNITQLLPAFLCFGFGLSLIMEPSYIASMENISEDKWASASGLTLALRSQIAPTIGMALMSAFYLTLQEGNQTDALAFKTINILAAIIAAIGVFISLFFLPSKRKMVPEFRADI